MNATTTKLSLDYLRGLGYMVDVVERWVPSGKGGQQVRRDLFGILDLVAIRDGETLGVQTTTKTNGAARARKMAESENAPLLQAAGWRLVVHGWFQPGGPRTRYQLEEYDLAPQAVVTSENELREAHERGEHDLPAGGCPECDAAMDGFFDNEGETP